MKVYLAFKKSERGLVSRLIRWRTNGVRTHVELVFTGRAFPSDARCFSADGAGTRFTLLDLSDVSKWDLVEVPGVDCLRAYMFCVAKNGKRYDWLTIIRYWFGLVGDSSAERWFCSEICVAALQAQGIFTGLVPSRTSPEDLWIAATTRFVAWREKDSSR